MWPDDATLQRRHNECDGVSNHRCPDCLLNHLSRYISKKTRKLQSSASVDLVRGIHRWPVDSPHKGPITQKMFPFHDGIMMHICNISSGNGLSPLRCQAITQAHADLFSSESSGTYFSEILTMVKKNSVKENVFKMSAKWRPYRPILDMTFGLNLFCRRWPSCMYVHTPKPSEF